MKRVAHYNIDQIWSAYPLQDCKENIKRSQEDLFLNLSYGTLYQKISGGMRLLSGD